jgi:hypothetical protein
METDMTEEKMAKGLCTGFHLSTDPGTALIIVYVSIVLFLLLFAGLESVRAAEKTFNNVHHDELMIPALEEGGVVDTPSLVQNAKIPVSDTTSKTTSSSESLMIFGAFLLLLALTLAKDQKER